MLKNLLPIQTLSRRIQFAVMVALALLVLPFHQASACGGFFCELVPIDQAGEEIIFDQRGNDITAMVRIRYEGDAENFSWVVPVPNLPEISLGADQTFDQLEGATRPQFILQRTGDVCAFPEASTDGATNFPTSAADTAGGVNIEQQLSVGPFDITIVSSDNPDELAHLADR